MHTNHKLLIFLMALCVCALSGCTLPADAIDSPAPTAVETPTAATPTAAPPSTAPPTETPTAAPSPTAQPQAITPILYVWRQGDALNYQLIGAVENGAVIAALGENLTVDTLPLSEAEPLLRKELSAAREASDNFGGTSALAAIVARTGVDWRTDIRAHLINTPYITPGQSVSLFTSAGTAGNCTVDSVSAWGSEINGVPHYGLFGRLLPGDGFDPDALLGEMTFALPQGASAQRVYFPAQVSEEQVKFDPALLDLTVRLTPYDQTKIVLTQSGRTLETAQGDALTGCRFALIDPLGDGALTLMAFGGPSVRSFVFGPESIQPGKLAYDSPYIDVSTLPTARVQLPDAPQPISGGAFFHLTSTRAVLQIGAVHSGKMLPNTDTLHINNIKAGDPAIAGVVPQAFEADPLNPSGSVIVTNTACQPGARLSVYSPKKKLGEIALGGMFPAYSGASGSVYTRYEIESGIDTLSSVPAFAMAFTSQINPLPRAVQIEQSDTRTKLVCDIAGDGKQYTLTQERKAKLRQGESYSAPIRIALDGKTVQEVPCEFDDIYTTGGTFHLMDLDGDGDFDLLREGFGHNSFLVVMEWKDGKFADTEVGWYMGD